VILDVRELAPGSNQWMLRFEDEAGNVSATVVKAFRKVPVQAALPGGKEEPAPLDAGSSSVAMSPMPSGSFNQPSSAAAPARSGSDSSRVFVIRYRVQAGETFRKIAKKFYGKKSLAPILIRWNGFYNPSSWPRLPEGALIEVPVWRDLQHGDVFFKDAMESFPWSRYPVAKERRR
jgi:LysM domain